MVFEKTPVKETALGFSLGLLLTFWKCALITKALGALLWLAAGLRWAFGAFALALLYGNLYLASHSPAEFSTKRMEISGEVLARRPLFRGESLLVETPHGQGEIFSPLSLPECEPGARFKARVRLRSPGYLNPFAPSPEIRRLSRGLSFRAALKREKDILCFAPEGKRWWEVLRERLFFFAAGLSPEARGLFSALILGEKTFLPGELQERVKALGLYHFLAVSGFHLGLLYALLYGVTKRLWPRLCRFSGVPAQIPAALTGLFGAGFYAALSGFPPSALRALTMLALYTFSRVLFRRTSGFDILAGAVLILLAFSPGSILDLSFRLSVLAVCGVILGHRLASLRLRGKNLFLRYSLEALAVSLGAWLFTFPLLLYTFGEVPLLGPLNTVILTPLWCFLLIPGEMLAALLVPVAPGWALTLTEFLAEVARAGIDLPLPSPLLRPPWPVGLFVLFLLTLATAAFLVVKRKIWPAISALLLALALFVLGWWVRDRFFYLLALDIGKGNAILVHLPGNRNLLFDAGARFGDFDAGKHLLAPTLRKLGIDTLDLVLLSHPDLDHTGGLPALLGEFHLKKILSGRFPKSSWEKIGRPFPLEEIEAPLSLRLGEAEILLFPGSPLSTNKNRASLVAYLEYRGLTVFFPGDIDTSRFQRLYLSRRLIPAEVFVLPHHGSRSGLFTAGWEALRFRMALVLARGRKHPHPLVREWLKTRGYPFYETGKTGALALFLRAGRFLVCPERDLRPGLPKALLWPYIPYVTSDGCYSYEFHTLRDL